MAFNTYGELETTDKEVFKEEQEHIPNYLFESHNDPINTCPYSVFDVSNYNQNDVVALIDGDWLTFSATSNEMERFIICEIDGIRKEFSGLEKLKEFLVADGRGDEYKTIKYEKGQRNKPLYVSLGNIKKKVASIVKETNATKVIIVLGSTGNKRLELPLPKYHGQYKGNRDGWIPDTLPEAKEWTRKKWKSWWSVDKESDDDVTIIFHKLLGKGIKVFICGVDKDYNQEHFGGLFLIGHHDKPTWYDNTEENALGYLEIVEREVISRKTGKPSGKFTSDVKGHGDMFLAYQILSEDKADNYSGKSFLKEFGNKKKFGDVEVVRLLSKCKTRKQLWQTVYDTFKTYLPESFEYIAWNDEVIQSSPLHACDLFYKCACMMKYAGFVANVTDLFDELGVVYEK